MFRRVMMVVLLCASGCVPALAQSEDAIPELVTDRPDFTESSDVVGKGFVQFETGTTVEFNHSAEGSERTVTTPLGLVRIGLSDRVELRLSSDGFVSSTLKTSDETFHSHGASDMEIGAKVKLIHSEKWGLDAAVIPMITVPAGSSEMTSGAYDPTLKLTYAKSLGRGFDLSGNVNFSRVTDGDEVFNQRAYSFSVGHDLGGNWGAYWEAYGFSSLSQDGGAAWTLDTGISRGLGANAQIDVEFGRGITAAAPSWFVGFGFAVRGRPAGKR